MPKAKPIEGITKNLQKSMNPSRYSLINQDRKLRLTHHKLSFLQFFQFVFLFAVFMDDGIS